MVDVAIVLGGGGPERVRWGARLWHQGRVRRLLLAGGRRHDSRTEAEAMAAEAARLGVPRDCLCLEQESRTTWENAEKAAALLAKLRAASAVVVTSDYHLPRARFIFRQVCGDSPVIVGYVGAPSGRSGQIRRRIHEWLTWPCSGAEALTRAVARTWARPEAERGWRYGRYPRPGHRRAPAGGNPREQGVSGAGAARRPH